MYILNCSFFFYLVKLFSVTVQDACLWRNDVREREIELFARMVYYETRFRHISVILYESVFSAQWNDFHSKMGFDDQSPKSHFYRYSYILGGFIFMCTCVQILEMVSVDSLSALCWGLMISRWLELFCVFTPLYFYKSFWIWNSVHKCGRNTKT